MRPEVRTRQRGSSCGFSILRHGRHQNFCHPIGQGKDEAEIVLRSFAKYATVPIINMESATAHPLQALADAITIKEHLPKHKPKVVLTWAPHPKALPTRRGQFFYKNDGAYGGRLWLCHPQGYALNPEITTDVKCVTNQEEALEGSRFCLHKKLVFL